MQVASGAALLRVIGSIQIKEPSDGHHWSQVVRDKDGSCGLGSLGCTAGLRARSRGQDVHPIVICSSSLDVAMWTSCSPAFVRRARILQNKCHVLNLSCHKEKCRPRTEAGAFGKAGRNHPCVGSQHACQTQ